MSARRQPKAALLDIFFYHDMDRYYELPGCKRVPSYTVFVTSAEGTRRVELGDANQIDEQVRRWRERMSRRDTADDISADLAARLWAPVEKLLPKDLKTLYLCADGELAAMPWEALPIQEDRRRQLIDRDRTRP